MNILLAFLVGTFFSFIGSIPPGTLNLTVLQLCLENKMQTARRFALAVIIVEYPYAWIAVKFERLILSSPVIIDNFRLIAALVMTALGLINIMSREKPGKLREKFEASGFRRGLILSLLNPMAIPFWIGITAYVESQQWITLSSTMSLHSYLLGTAVGVTLLFVVLGYFAQRLSTSYNQRPWVRKIPGYTLLVLGLYAFVQYLF